MTTLNAAQIQDIRDITGADDPGKFDDTRIQAQYDTAATDAPDSALVLPYTYVYVLRRLWGLQRTKADIFTDHGDRQTRSQIGIETKKLLDYWEKYTGLGGGISGQMQVGTLNLNLDYTCDDLEAGL